MSSIHLLIVAIPSLLVGLLFARTLTAGIAWGIVAELIGLLLRAMPTLGLGGPRGPLTLRDIVLSLALGAIAGAVGFGLARLGRGARR
jgi:hypothetical protein